MDLEARIAQLGTQLFAEAKNEEPGLFNRNYWQGRMLDWVMKDQSFKVDLLRFVDVLPQLNSSDSISEHVRQYLVKEERPLPALIGVALKAATSRLTAKLATRAIRDNVMDMAGRFILGSTAQDAVPALKKLHVEGIAFTVDLLGEATLSESEAEIYAERYLNLITKLSQSAGDWPQMPSVDQNHLGRIPRVNVSIKISAMSSLLRPTDPGFSVAQVKKRLLPILRVAKEQNVFVNFDLEQWDYHEITYDLFEDIVAEPEFRNWPHLGIVVQAYLKSAERDVERITSIANARKCPLTIRLVKGAYWDFEVVRARQKGLEPPVLLGKSICDANFERLSTVLFDRIDILHGALGSHNLRSLAHAIAYAESKGIPKNAYEIQMLYGMAEPERRALRSLGHRLRLYSPVGDLLVGMAYLVRRLLENTSNSGFLQLTHHAKTNIEELMKKPSEESQPSIEPKKKDGAFSFENCAFLDFLNSDVRKEFQRNIDLIRKDLPKKISFSINAQKNVPEKSNYDHICPSDRSLKVYELSFASRENCEIAVQSAYSGFLTWRNRSVDERADILMKLADILEKDRYWLAALQTLEVGKPWAEADGDVAEAIDFCRFYALRAQIELKSSPQGDMFGEENDLHYVGLGPTAIIAPWNFPLAILCGMSTAALVAGNSILMKPSEQSSMTALALYERMLAAGFPKDIIQFLPGNGEEIGPYLVEHPLVAQIAFTGSRTVGLSIYRAAAKTQNTQPELKRVVCEMGGKNAIIVDDDADLDEAVLGVVGSAFGFAGQKCSACSRVIVIDSVADAFIERLVQATRSQFLEQAHKPSCFLGPVIDEEAQTRLLSEIARAQKETKTHYIGENLQGGFFVPPAIFEVDKREHWLLQEEFFGPILALIRAPDFSTAIEIANSTSYALTGAVFSRSPKNLKLARETFQVGNLYLNRGCTGAMVNRQPFGGFRMSGLGSKAGGFGYLLNFAQAACITENTMRRGFTPDVEV